MKFLTFGEIMLRLKAPGQECFFQSPMLEATFGGGEANVAVSLANYGEDAAFLTVLPDNPITDACVRELRGFGVDTSRIVTGNGLKDVANAINSSFPDPNNAGQNLLKASIQDGRLLIETNSASNVQFALGADTSGLMAALGVNAFFTGTGADDLAVNSQMHSDVNYIAAGQVNGQYQVNAGDNATATAIAKLADTTVTISTVWKTVSNQTISQYYANLVTTVGADTRSVQTNAEYHTALTSDLEDQVSSVTGVNLDEEMANLIKYQHSYTAAAKLITTADQMLQTLLGLKE